VLKVALLEKDKEGRVGDEDVACCMSSKYCSLVSRKLEANKRIERTCACVLPKNGVEGDARALELSFKNDRAENFMIDC
jgi:hypothetical protein